MFADWMTLSRAGRELNEDAVGAGEHFLFVIDGATGLSGKPVMGTGSDARWLAQYTKEQLLLHLQDPSSIGEILTEIMVQLRHTWKGSPDAMPSAGIAVWRQRGEQLEYFGLGDCSASALLVDGSVRVFQETALAALDGAALAEMQRLCRAEGCSMPQARERISDLLIAHRRLRNTPEGYWCLDPSGLGISHARTAVLPLDQCRSVFACSDGYEQLVAFGCAQDLPALHRLTLQQGPDALARQLFLSQEADRDLCRVPRFKLRDDTSAAVARCISDEGTYHET